MKKKLVTVLLASSMVATMLAGCGSGSGDGQGRGRTDHRHTTYFAGHGQIQQDVDHHGWRLRGQPIRLRGTVSLSYRRRDFHRRETVQV